VVKRLWREADHSLPYFAEVKNGGAIPPLPIRPHGLVLNRLSTVTTLAFIVAELFTPAVPSPGSGPHVNLLQALKLAVHLMLIRVLQSTGNFVCERNIINS
jgi:hypothetical protein